MKKIYSVDFGKGYYFVEASSMYAIKRTIPSIPTTKIHRVNCTSPLYSYLVSNRNYYYSLEQFNNFVNGKDSDKNNGNAAN